VNFIIGHFDDLPPELRALINEYDEDQVSQMWAFLAKANKDEPPTFEALADALEKSRRLAQEKRLKSPPIE
jgi:hypothetical protein